MTRIADARRMLRHTFPLETTMPANLAELATAADAAIAGIAPPSVHPPGLHPLMHDCLVGLYGAASVARLEAAIVLNRHGAGDEPLGDDDPADQARFETACARELAGDRDA